MGVNHAVPNDGWNKMDELKHILAHINNVRYYAERYS
jgi:hypothetical protein